jgi:hypothetical protein
MSPRPWVRKSDYNGKGKEEGGFLRVEVAEGWEEGLRGEG